MRTLSKENVLMIMYGKSVGGAELQFIELANYLVKKHPVRLISLGGDGAVHAAALDREIELKVIPYRGSISMAYSLIKTFFANVCYPSGHVITTSFIGNLFGYVLAMFRNCRLLSLQTVSKCMCHPRIDQFILSRFDVLIAGANDIKNYLILHGQDAKRIEVIHNWVDFSKRGPVKSVRETKNQFGIIAQTVIGCVGRLHVQKGQIYLIRAFAKISEEFPDSCLLLVGDGSTRSELENEIRKLGLGGKVIFAGTITGEDYNNLLAIIDIYVQPSLFEGLPRTLLDAMCMGKPIVATDINGNREAIENEKNGILVLPKDIAALTKAIIVLLHDSEVRKRLSEQAAKSAADNFSMIKKLKDIESLLLSQP